MCFKASQKTYMVLWVKDFVIHVTVKSPCTLLNIFLKGFSSSDFKVAGKVTSCRLIIYGSLLGTCVIFFGKISFGVHFKILEPCISFP